MIDFGHMLAAGRVCTDQLRSGTVFVLTACVYVDRCGAAARGQSPAPGVARPAVGADGAERQSAALAQAALPSPHARDLQTRHQRTRVHLPAGPGGASILF